jgi:hypothetical protein
MTIELEDQIRAPDQDCARAWPPISDSRRVAIPLYQRPPSPDWERALAAAPLASLLVVNIATPGGPGRSALSTYSAAIAAARKLDQVILGYVDTDYARRSPVEVEDEIRRWYDLYGIAGIFVDRVTADGSYVDSYYRAVSDIVRGRCGTVVMNPGTRCLVEDYMRLCDVLVTFEDVYARYLPGAYGEDPPWVRRFSATRFWHIVLDAPSIVELTTSLRLSRERNAGYVFVSDRGPATAFARLPNAPYWRAELGMLTEKPSQRDRSTVTELPARDSRDLCVPIAWQGPEGVRRI